jgi:hypothetical protein
MPDARSVYYSRMEAYKDAVSHASVLAGPPSAVRENERARIVRSGLAVIGFAILEDFLRTRAQEILSGLGRYGLRFDQLPIALRRLATLNALRAINFQLQIRDAGRDDISYIQEMAGQIASTSTTSFDICGVTFGYESANLSEATIDTFLEAFFVEKPWQCIGQIASKAGIGPLGARHRAAFTDMALRRHRAAHDPTADFQPSELHSAALDAVGIALGFDAILSFAAYKLRLRDQEYLAGRRPVKLSDLCLYFVDDFGTGRYGSKKHNASRYKKIYTNVDNATDHARSFCMGQQMLFVIRDARGIPVRWDFPCL